MKKTRKLALVLLAAAMLFLVACGSGGDTTTPTASTSPTPGGGSGTASTSPSASAPPSSLPSEGGDAMAGNQEAAPEGANLADHINIILGEEFVVLNPILPAGNGGAPTFAHRLVHDRLVDHPEPGVFTPQLAHSWETSDFKTWTFYLNENVYWHSGEHFTADDVKFSVENALANVGTLAYNRFRAVESVNVIDPYTVQLILATPNVDILFEFGNFGGASILSRAAHDANPDDPMWASIGTGPYRITEFQTSVVCRLERNDDYFGELPITKYLTLTSTTEQTTRAVMLLNGEGQIGSNLNATDLDSFVLNDDFQVYSMMNVSPTCLSFNNMGSDLIMDMNFRLALAHGINVDDIALAALGNWAVPPWDGNVWGAGVQYRVDNMPRRDYDPALAKQYLGQSLYQGEPVKLIIVTGPSVAAEVIQMQLLNIGVNIEIETIDLASLVAMHTWDPNSDTSMRQLHLFGIAANPSALRTLTTGFIPLSATNRLNYANERVSELTTILSSTDDEAVRRDAAHEIQWILYDDIPAIPVYFSMSANVAVNGIGGIRLGNDPFMNCYRGIYWDLDQTPASLRP